MAKEKENRSYSLSIRQGGTEIFSLSFGTERALIVDDLKFILDWIEQIKEESFHGEK